MVLRVEEGQPPVGRRRQQERLRYVRFLGKIDVLPPRGVEVNGEDVVERAGQRQAVSARRVTSVLGR